MTNAQTPVAQPAPTHCPICGATQMAKDSSTNSMYYACGATLQYQEKLGWHFPYLLHCPDVQGAYYKLQAECERLRAELSQANDWMNSVRIACHEAMGSNATFIDDDVLQTIKALHTRSNELETELSRDAWIVKANALESEFVGKNNCPVCDANLYVYANGTLRG